MALPTSLREETHSIVRNGRLYINAEQQVAETWLWLLIRKAALSLMGLALLLFALGMLNIAAFQALMQMWGPVRTPIYIGLAEVALASILMLLAYRVKAGARLRIAEEKRDNAALALEAGVRQFSLASILGGVIGGIVEARTERLLTPIIASMMKSLKNKAGKVSGMPGRSKQKAR